MRRALLAAALATLCSGCPVAVVDPGPCSRCDVDCDDGPIVCDRCRSEECPD
jgi:hypothetical protein